MERTIKVTKNVIVKKREKIYSNVTQSLAFRTKEIAFIIRSYKKEENDSYSLITVKNFCERKKIKWFEPKNEFIGETKIEQIVGSALLCDFGIAILPKTPNENVGLEIGLLMSLAKPIFILKGRNVSRKIPFDYDSFIYIKHNSTQQLLKDLLAKHETHELRHVQYEELINKILKKVLKPLFSSKTDQLAIALGKSGIQAQNNQKNIKLFIESWKKNPQKTLESLERGMILDLATRVCKIENVAKSGTNKLCKGINNYLIEEISKEKSLFLAYQGKHAIADMLINKK